MSGRRSAVRERRSAEESSGGSPGGPHDLVLAWQAVAGNAAVARLLARQPAPTTTDAPTDEAVTETGKEGASKWFERAQKAYLAKDFRKAYDAFMRAYRLLQAPEFLYNAAAALELGGDPDAAIAMYERYLTEAPSASDAERVRKHIETVKQKPVASGPDDEPPIAETGAEGASKWFDRAQAAYQAKNYGKAHTGFMHAYRLLGRPEFLYNAAAALQMGGDIDGAIAMYDRYLAEAPGAGDAERVRKAVEKLRKKEIGGQVDDTAGGSATGDRGGEQPITATGDDGATQWFDRAQTQYAAGKYEEAVQSFGKAFELSPKPDFVYNQGTALEKQGRAAAAAAAYERYLALAPEAKDYAQVAKRTKKLREQAASDPIVDPWADEAAGTDPTATGKEGAQQWFDKAQAAYMVGDYPAAHSGFMHAYKELPRPEFLYNAGAALDMGGDAAGAVELYERYLAEKPGASDAGKVQKRIAKLKAKAAGGAEPGSEGGEPPIEETGKEGARKWFDRGEQQFRAAKFEEAVHSFGTAFELEPSPAYVYDQGLALERQGRPAAAAAAYERYLALKPDAGNHDDVVEKVKKLLGQAAADPIVDPWADEAAGPDPAAEGKEGAKQWYEKAAVSFQVGDYGAAQAGFMRAFALWPRAEYLFDAARALEEAGDASGAIALYERSLSEGGGIKDGALAQKRIDQLKAKADGGGEPSSP